MKRFKRFALVALAALLPLGLAGCIQIDQTLVLNRDGSGSFRIDYGMAERTIVELQAMKALAKELDFAAGKKSGGSDEELSSSFLFDEGAIRKLFKTYQSYGIQLDDLKMYSRGDWKHADLSVSFKNVADLTRIALLSQNGFSLTKGRDGNYMLSQKFNTGGNVLDMSDPEVAKSMTPILAGFRLTSKVTTPGTIRQTNASRHTLDTATWDVDFNKEPQLIGQLQTSGMSVVFEGKGLNFAPTAGEKPASQVAAPKPAPPRGN